MISPYSEDPRAKPAIELIHTARRNHTTLLVTLALLFTLLNAFKPLCIDDALYSYRAHQAAVHPLDPYGFLVYWNDRPEPAIQVLAPPLFPYYWAVAIRLFGEHPVWWKLWLLPLALMLVFSLYSLFRRFAPGYELWLTMMTIISPVFLPSFNLMLEVPVAALGLLALNLFLRACDRESFALAAVAGLVNGLAMETKYTAFITVAVILLYSLIFRKLRLGLVAAALGAAFFLTIEGLTVWRYGHSHFLYQSHLYSAVNPFKKYVYLAWPAVTLLGALAPFAALLGLVALKVRSRFIIAAAAIILLGYVLLALAPGQYQVLTRDPRTNQERLTLAHLIFSVFGVAVWGTLVAVSWRLCRLSIDWKNYLSSWRQYSVEWFLVLWLILEIGGYFALSPIPATRRVVGILIVSTLVLGRLASQTCQSLDGRRLFKGLVMGSMALGLLFYAVDFRDAEVEKIAVERAVQKIREQRLEPGAQLPSAREGDVWYVARWGFQYYAERSGMKPVIADESQFQAGDWLVISDGPHHPQVVTDHIGRYQIEPVAWVTIADSFPLHTMLGYYNSGIPIDHHEGPRRSVRLYRIRGPIGLQNPER